MILHFFLILLKEFYQKPLFRKLAFRRFIRTKQSEVKLLNEIENTYLTKEEIKQDKKIVILHGDYSRTSQMKGCISTPNIGMKKLLLSRFDIVEVTLIWNWKWTLVIFNN
jgi:hypothetical protein